VRSMPCKSGGAELRPCASCEELLHLPREIREGRVRRGPPHLNHDRPLRSELAQVQAYCRSQPASHPVPGHAVAQGLRSGKTDFRPVLPLDLQTDCREVRPREPQTPLVNCPKVRSPQQSSFLGKGQVLPGAFNRIIRRNEQLSPSLRSASCGLWPGGAKERPGRPSFSSSPGIREFWPACGCSAEMCVLACFYFVPRARHTSESTLGQGAAFASNCLV
jgi:hypothetical protein